MVGNEAREVGRDLIMMGLCVPNASLKFILEKFRTIGRKEHSFKKPGYEKKQVLHRVRRFVF